MKFIWVVMQWIGQRDDGSDYDWQGAFDTREAAVAACKTSAFSVTRLILNQDLPTESIGCGHQWYPHTESEPE